MTSRLLFWLSGLCKTPVGGLATVAIGPRIDATGTLPSGKGRSGGDRGGFEFALICCWRVHERAF